MKTDHLYYLIQFGGKKRQKKKKRNSKEEVEIK